MTKMNQNFLAKMKTAAIIAGFLTFAACGGDAKDKAKEVVKEVEKVEETVKPVEKVKEEVVAVPELPAKAKALLGEHKFRLQWIDGKGVCEFKNVNGELRVTGKYELKGDFVSLDASVDVVNDKEIVLNGTIITKVSHINQGKECKREGKYMFRSTKGRKYWRMQNMDNCEPGNVVDYVDIYFK